MEASSKDNKQRFMLSGNEAVAMGCREAGVHLGSGYPGTPSTEILETIAKMVPEMYVQWSPNEKVGLEVAAGAAFSGARTICTQKHVGLNVAADPFMTLSYIGVKGGMIVISADDPELHSSQNEQDNRHYARFGKVPMVEPSDSQESKDMIASALDISEEFDTPVLFRMTTRISHGKSIVEPGEIQSHEITGFKKDAPKFVMVPAHARKRHVVVEERMVKLQEFSETTPLNFIEWSDKKIGVISSGAAYSPAREVLPDASFLKLGFTYPLPLKKIREFADQVDRLLVVEELDPFIEDQLKAVGIACEGKNATTLLGEMTPGRLATGLVKIGVLDSAPAVSDPTDVLPRPPVLCSGCPHRSIYVELKKRRGFVFGDIGCYTLGALPPLSSLDCCLDMGASISTAIGSSKVSDGAKPIYAIIGDSTFLHSGITGVLDAVYNKANINVLIVDNRITAMTGGQQHPATGMTLMGEPAKAVNIVDLVRALGVEDIQHLKNNDQENVRRGFERAEAYEGVSVLIAQSPCMLMPRKLKGTPYFIDPAICIGCRRCLQIGCPSLSLTGEFTAKERQQVVIDPATCTGCSVCAQVCPQEAIHSTEVSE
ncbi:MAG: indolepyruvate ferredoxin oxidoreductase subunit alpha [bacterium]|nr:indolepyruvate ferredoxin oxidoreductase subunit alpha [bacterium]